MNIDCKNWSFQKSIKFLLVFFILYGLSAYHIAEFKQMYLDPFSILPEKSQWLHESPIQYFIGNALFKNLNWSVAYIFTNLIGVSAAIMAYVLMLKSREISHSEMFIVLALSPFFIVVFTFFGKPDTFLIAGCFGMLASHDHYRFLFPIFMLVSVFSHPQITLFYILFFVILQQIKLNFMVIISLILSFFLYALYIQEIGDFDGRATFIADYVKNLLETQIRQPFFSLFCTFGWLWLPIIFYKKELGFRFIVVSFLCFCITIMTLDHTRVFVLLSVPLLVYISTVVSVTKYATYIDKFVPIIILMLFQFQKRANGEIIDTAWSWFWAPKVAQYLGLL